MYGYEITQKVKELTAGKVALTEGALYPMLHKLESDGVLITEKEYVGKRLRKYYSLTPAGKSVVAQKVNELTEFLATMRDLLKTQPTTS